MNRSGQSDDGDSVVETIHERRPTVAPADCVLIALPALLLAGWAAGVLSALSLSVAVVLGTLPAIGMLGYALFYDPPNGCV
jgi:hypothetical protein